ncbi:MAG: RNA polymerase factor sigma-54 [Betaproteobacteria bacterium]|nr:RNA polymerase factor sigma-54 [Betaproteobacteria bacterium]MDE2621781.1 RNA polymerase factor sigma-54 [Betaproteobacteria bacterium]
MKVNLQLKHAQHLALTPQLQQSIRLLQLSTMELDQELEKFLMENPMLEREETGTESPPPAPARTSGEPEITAPEIGTEWNASESWTPEEGPAAWRDSDDEPETFQQASSPITLVDHLSAQLRLMPLNERDHQLMSLLIAHLDESGYLQASLEDIQAAAPEAQAVEPDELHVALRLLQSLDPAGVGARDLAECLSLQISALPGSTPGRTAALALVKEHLPLLAAHDFTRLKKLLGTDDATLRQAQKLITGLNPKPGAAFVQSETRYVMPDVIVRKTSGKWVASLNRDAMPKLRINALYANLMKNGRESGSSLTSQLQEARWLIKNIQQRFDTILRVSKAIVERQENFLEHGEVAMRPLVLREIADELGLHESTISRVTSQKYMLTPRGLFELKYFFSSHVGTETGGAASSTAIRALIKQLISAEDRKNPLSDSRISDILAEQGITVARRTVAKYREALQIHPASQRKVI